MSEHEPLRTARIGDIAVPRHVAIIMDGNGRWAAARGLPRGEGHRRGRYGPRAISVSVF